jgi:hypothetical protein
MFNQFIFLEDLKNSIHDEINHITDIYEFVCDVIGDNTVYYSDCFDIIKACNFTDFRHCDSVMTAAEAALHEMVIESDVFEYYRLLKSTMFEEEEETI